MGQLMDKMCKSGRKKNEIPQIQVMGYHSSGSTMLMYKMELGLDAVSPSHPDYYSSDSFEVEYKDMKFQIRDTTGGRGGFEHLFQFYYQFADAIIFVIDSTRKDRFPEIIEEIEYLLGEKKLKDIISVTMANMQDSPDAVPATELEELINKNRTDGMSKMKVFPTTIINDGEGVAACLDWLYDEIERKHRKEVVVKPWKEVTNDISEDGKAGLKVVGGTWKKIKSHFLFKG